jgi:cytidylate kinase
MSAPRPFVAAPTADEPFIPPGAVVAIDGPAGSGKSTTARAVADRLGLLYVDTGAMYRALTWAALEGGIPPADAARLEALLSDARLELRPGDGGGEARVLWNGRDISAAVRTSAVGAAVSIVSAHPGVRARMVERQRALGRAGPVVVEGRDIGSQVFPLAHAKIYLDASLDARVDRRVRQNRARGLPAEPGPVTEEIEARDRLDSSREASPLVIAPDALVLDTSAWDLAEQIDRVTAAVLSLFGEGRPRPPDPHSRAGRIPPHYRFAYLVFGVIGRLGGLRVIGREHLDQPGGIIIAPNHISWWDPPIVGGTVRRGCVHAVAKEELFGFRPFGALLRAYDVIPIRRSGYDTRAFGDMLSALERGEDVLVFPEGTRRPFGRPGPIRSAIGILMQKTGAPAVPALVRGTRAIHRGGPKLSPLEVRYGPAVRPRALPALRARYDDREITRRIGALFQAIYEELLARSLAEHPLTDWERADQERQIVACAKRDEVVFRNRTPRPKLPAG